MSIDTDQKDPAINQPLSQERLQAFSDQVAEICEYMSLNEEQILEAIGTTFIGATMSFGRTEFAVEIDEIARASVDTIFKNSKDD